MKTKTFLLTIALIGAKAAAYSAELLEQYRLKPEFSQLSLRAQYALTYDRGILNELRRRYQNSAGITTLGNEPAAIFPNIPIIDIIGADIRAPIGPGSFTPPGAWGVITVDADGDTGYNPSMALDSSGRPHIAYYHSRDTGQVHTGDLRYARWDGNKWIMETVKSEGDAGGTPSLALDASSNPRISFCSFTSSGAADDLWYAYKGTSGWAFELVDSAGNVGLYSSLKVDSNGKARIAYQDTTLGKMDLKYAERNTSGQWRIETVDSAGDVGQFASLDVDSLGRAHIAYLDFTNYDLKYARQDASGPSGSTWTKETADSTGQSGFFASLKIDASGTVHIAHQDAAAQDLRYAKKASGGTWHTKIIDSTGDVGEYASLALDSTGKPHIAYYDDTKTRLKYARLINSSWSTDVVSGAGADSWNTSIQVDKNGIQHIAYLDFVQGDLKYARWSNRPTLSWTKEPGYAADGVEPNNGNAYTRFVYRIKYTDQDGDPPLAGQPKVHVKRGTGTVTEISGSPFSMNQYASSGPGTASYEYSLWLTGGSDYIYTFEAQDRWGVWAVAKSSRGPSVTDTGLPPEGEEVFAYPNPATGDKVTFRVALGYLAPTIELKIFDLAGELVEEIPDERFPKIHPPVYEYTWNMTDSKGQKTASGVYVYYVRARDQQSGKEFKAVKKFAILK
ncbi:MAG: hypothetical protein HY747_01280 [Elusimicrobia bacterium]|nr:hypothetical protein [Elusimicrobiota bacterium]